MKVAAGASVRLKTRLATVYKEWRRRRDCYGDGPGDANDGEGFARGGTDSRGRKTAGSVHCARAAAEATGQRALYLYFGLR